MIMVMRVGGLATGMDIEAMVNKLMDAEKMPLTRMQQDRTMLEWQRDAFREINKKLLELDNMMLDMKMSNTYQTKKVSSSQANAVTAIGNTSALNGTYSINVSQLATPAINVSTDEIDIKDPNAKLSGYEGQIISFKTFNENAKNGEDTMKEYTYQIGANDTLNSVLKRITDDDNNVRSFYDPQAKKVVFETTRTGKYNQNGPEIDFTGSDNSFITGALKLSKTVTKDGDDNIIGGETGGENAKFTYNNGLTIESKNNWYELNNIVFEFHNVTDGNARLTVTNDVDHAYNAIMDFVNKYNEVVELINGSQQEEKFRDFKPLTDEQKKDMSEDEIKRWEEKAKSGILRGESALMSGMYSLRQSWYAKVETGGAFTSLTQIGITTSSKYMDGGKLEVNEEKLKAALRENPDDVQKLFSNSSTGDSRGLVQRLEDAVDGTMKKIEERAGKSYHTLDNYTIGKRLKDLNNRISAFEARMIKVENRYWNQFTQMEKAIQRMNDQSAQLFSQFGG